MLKMTLFSLFCAVTLLAKEPTMGILESISSNTKQTFLINNTRYRCDAYGVLDFDKLFNDSAISGVCKEKLKKFHAKNPHAKHFTQSKLYIFAMYHLEFVKERCLLYASGEITLSEMLLKEGFVVLEPAFEDEEYARLYKNAQNVARFEKRGIWEDEGMEECLAHLLKEEDEEE